MGITVIVAAIVLMITIILMSQATGVFSSKLTLRAFFENAGGLRVGAPVRLQGVDIGNVTEILINPHDPSHPVEVVMKVGTRYHSLLRTDSSAMLGTAGVLGETFVDIDSIDSHGERVHNNAVLPSKNRPDIQDVIRSSEASLQNLNTLVNRLNDVVGQIQQGKGSVGKLIYDASLYNKLNSTLTQVQEMVGDITNAKGSIGKLIEQDDLYNHASATLDKLNNIIDQINNGQGTAGRFIKDPTLYNNANETITRAKQLMADINDKQLAAKLSTTIGNLQDLTDKMNQGQGTMGKLFQDPSVYNNTDNLLTETRNLIEAIRKNPKKYLTIHLKLF